MKNRRISTTMRPHITLMNLLVHPKNNAEHRKRVYKIKYQEHEGCYVGGSKNFAVRVKVNKADVNNTVKDWVFTWGKKETISETERSKLKSAITDHVCQTNHLLDWDSAGMVEWESDWTDMGIKEAIITGKHPQNFSRDTGWYNLSYLYDDLLPGQTTKDWGRGWRYSTTSGCSSVTSWEEHVTSPYFHIVDNDELIDAKTSKVDIMWTVCEILICWYVQEGFLMNTGVCYHFMFMFSLCPIKTYMTLRIEQTCLLFSSWHSCITVSDSGNERHWTHHLC